ncbi:uncharacterized protein J3D65DRAFT_90915 [Phyllosticta citribraziliensis]|uniref:Uncharacterized protein n=1 Tax=Phyllosticta citribraziliensis TaxID=989973 RepID=A0ABR1L9Z1_9PEZI
MADPPQALQMLSGLDSMSYFSECLQLFGSGWALRQFSSSFSACSWRFDHVSYRGIPCVSPRLLRVVAKSAECGQTTKEIMVDAPNGTAALASAASLRLGCCSVFQLCSTVLRNTQELFGGEEMQRTRARLCLVASEGLIASTGRRGPMIPRCGHPRSDSISSPSPSSPPPHQSPVESRRVTGLPRPQVSTRASSRRPHVTIPLQRSSSPRPRGIRRPPSTLPPFHNREMRL